MLIAFIVCGLVAIGTAVVRSVAVAEARRIRILTDDQLAEEIASAYEWGEYPAEQMAEQKRRTGRAA